ncbi:MAG: hypothetical protein HC799_03230 [Limnothrix sp. RL_2_0]|nr:hypothetical protein [Limnothrix sp. RL_2_0]
MQSNQALLSIIPYYQECLYCGYVDRNLAGQKCPGYGVVSDETVAHFPESAYEYVILLEDYYQQKPSKVLEEYFEENILEMWTSGNPRVKEKPISDWKPMMVILFRSLFELLLDHCLWKLIRVQLCPSPHSKEYAYFLLKQFPSVSAKQGKCYPFVTQSKWKEDLKKFGFQDLDELLKEAARIRNEFIHADDPTSGHHTTDFPERLRSEVPNLFTLFVQIANEYYHPYAEELSKIEVHQIANVTGD